MTPERLGIVGFVWIAAAITFGVTGASSLASMPLGVGIALLFCALHEEAILRAHRMR